MSKVSDLILEENVDILGRMLNHPFVNAIFDGSLPADAYHRYPGLRGRLCGNSHFNLCLRDGKGT